MFKIDLPPNEPIEWKTETPVEVEKLQAQLANLRGLLMEAVILMNESFETKTTFYDFLNRPEVQATIKEG